MLLLCISLEWLKKKKKKALIPAFSFSPRYSVKKWQAIKQQEHPVSEQLLCRHSVCLSWRNLFCASIAFCISEGEANWQLSLFRWGVWSTVGSKSDQMNPTKYAYKPTLWITLPCLLVTLFSCPSIAQDG